MSLVLSKLPGNVREKWNRNVMNITRRNWRKQNFVDLIHIVDDEAKLVDDLLFSKEVLIGYVDRKEVPNQRRELKAYLTAAKKRTRKPENISHIAHQYDQNKMPKTAGKGK